MPKLTMKNLLKEGEFFVDYTFDVPIKSAENKLEQSSQLQGKTIVAVKCRPTSSVNKGLLNQALASDATARSSYLTLKRRSTEYAHRLPIDLIQQNTAAGYWYNIHVPNVDMAQSNVLISNETAKNNSVTAGEVFQFTVRYIEVEK